MINELSNLTLLDSRTNRSYKNSIFPIKRNVILSKSGIENFIPVCTKNVFLKYYSKDVTQMYMWGKKDREDYIREMLFIIFLNKIMIILLSISKQKDGKILLHILN